MFRRCILRRTSLHHTAVPLNIQNSYDFAFFFPRFSPQTHQAHFNIPEIKETVALLRNNPNTYDLVASDRGGDEESVLPNYCPRWGVIVDPFRFDPSDAVNKTTELFKQKSKEREKALLLMERGIEILENLGGVATSSNAGKNKKGKRNDVAEMLRSLYATRFELLSGSEHLPLAEYGRHLHVQKSILAQSAKLIYYQQKAHNFYRGGGESDEKVNLKDLDVSCVIVANFMRAFSAIHTKPFHEEQTKPASGKATEASSNGVSGGGGGEKGKSPLSSLKSKGKSSSSSSGGDSAKNSVKDWKVEVAPGEFLTLAHISDEMEHLILLSRRAMKEQNLMQKNEASVQMLRDKVIGTEDEGEGGDDIYSLGQIRWNEPKLLLLRALLEIPLTGNLFKSLEFVQRAAQVTHEFHARGAAILDGLKTRVVEPELGLITLVEAELKARVFNYDDVSTDGGAGCEMDGEVLGLYNHCSEFFAHRFDTATEADGILQKFSASSNSTGELSSFQAANTFEALAYTLSMTSYANFLLGAPRPKGTTTKTVPVFLNKQLFTLNPIVAIASATPDLIFYDSDKNSSFHSTSGVNGSSGFENVHFTIEMNRKKCGQALERALQINRGLMPLYKQNMAATWTLLAMSCLYADTRDYLYAVGLFETVRKNMEAAVGTGSPQLLFPLRLRYEFLAGVGSEQEAQTAAHEIVGILKSIDKLRV